MLVSDLRLVPRCHVQETPPSSRSGENEARKVMWRMRIVMMTNTYAPHVGGVARSVEAFAAEYRRRGHQVLVGLPRVRERAATRAERGSRSRNPAVQRQRLLGRADRTALAPRHR